MTRITWSVACLAVALLPWTPARAQEGGEGTKELSGMSVLGNNEAPKSLVIVPWKSSKIGDGIGVANLLDQRAVPVDKEVFARELRYYELRTGSSGAAARQGEEP